jgi:hypothetical protein
MVKIYNFLLLIFIIFYSKAQNEFYNNGAVVYVNDKINTSTATLRVNGEIINNNGSFTNYQSLIELTGNWTNTSSTNYYVSTGIERFLGTTDQTIAGTWNGTASNQNQFYDLKVKKTTTSGQNVNLNVNTNVNSNGSLEFESTNGIIRSDVSSHTNNGSLYPYE